jgi:hypothetical protein
MTGFHNVEGTFEKHSAKVYATSSSAFRSAMSAC